MVNVPPENVQSAKSEPVAHKTAQIRIVLIVFIVFPFFKTVAIPLFIRVFRVCGYAPI